jgi:putative Holliday junction resolvase
MNNETRIMAVDYGEKRVGLALSDPLKIFAYPYKTIDNDITFWKIFLDLISENSVEMIILGYPLRESGEKSASTLMVEKFCDELKKRVKLPVKYWDERYSSCLAQEIIIQSVPGKKKRRNKGLLDMNAAAILLKEYLESIC